MRWLVLLCYTYEIYCCIKRVNKDNNVINIQLLNQQDTDYSHLIPKYYINCIADCKKCVKSLNVLIIMVFYFFLRVVCFFVFFLIFRESSFFLVLLRLYLLLWR